jgi:hypothetical protein
MSRCTIFAEVEMERMCQDTLWGEAYDDTHNRNAWIAMLTRHLGLGADDSSITDPDDAGARFRKQMIRVSAMAIAAVESYDRKTCSTKDHVVHREGTGA